MPRKLPGYEFMSYKQVQYFLTGMVSFDQALQMVNEILPLDIHRDLHRNITNYFQCKQQKCDYSTYEGMKE